MINAVNMATLMTANISSGTTALQASSAAASSGSLSDQQASKTAKDFEAMFISQMLEPMFGDSLGTESFGDANTKDIYKGMLMDAYGKEIAKAGGIGIAQYIKTELLKLQEIAHGQPNPAHPAAAGN
jgi:flagellar protein FlgJ